MLAAAPPFPRLHAHIYMSARDDVMENSGVGLNCTCAHSAMQVMAVVQKRRPSLESRLEVFCTVNPPVFLTVGGGDESQSHSSSGSGTSGCQVIDVHIRAPIPEKIQYIRFQNHYTYMVTIKFRSREPLGYLEPDSDPWQLCVKNLRLMPNCHCEQGGQDWVTLGEKLFLNRLEKVVQLRVILRQPSPHWRAFGIRELQCFPTPKADDIVLNPIQNQKIGVGNETDLEPVSERMEKMLELGTEAKSRLVHERREHYSDPVTLRQTDPSVPYELNLLSYS